MDLDTLMVVLNKEWFATPCLNDGGSMIDQLTQRVQELLKDTPYHVYEINWTSSAGNKVLQVVVGDDNFTIDLDGCALVSDKVSQLLDDEFDQFQDYFLEVCSPGAERELKTLDERLKASGHKVALRLTHPVDKQLEFEGVVDSINEQELTLTYRIKARSKTIIISMDNVEFMRLAV